MNVHLGSCHCQISHKMEPQSCVRFQKFVYKLPQHSVFLHQELLKFDKKQLRSVLNQLKNDKFLKCRSYVQTQVKKIKRYII